jgi:hypothetical protein
VEYVWTVIGLGLVVAAVIGFARVDFHRGASKLEGANPELARACARPSDRLTGARAPIRVSSELGRPGQPRSDSA